MVQALDEAHAVDIVLAQHPYAHVKAVPASSIEGMNKHRLLFSWLESLQGPGTSGSSGGGSGPSPLALGPAAARSEHLHPGS